LLRERRTAGDVAESRDQRSAHYADFVSHDGMTAFSGSSKAPPAAVLASAQMAATGALAGIAPQQQAMEHTLPVTQSPDKSPRASYNGTLTQQALLMAYNQNRQHQQPQLRPRPPPPLPGHMAQTMNAYMGQQAGTYMPIVPPPPPPPPRSSHGTSPVPSPPRYSTAGQNGAAGALTMAGLSDALPPPPPPPPRRNAVQHSAGAYDVLHHDMDPRSKTQQRVAVQPHPQHSALLAAAAAAMGAAPARPPPPPPPAVSTESIQQQQLLQLLHAVRAQQAIGSTAWQSTPVRQAATAPAVSWMPAAAPPPPPPPPPRQELHGERRSCSDGVPDALDTLPLLALQLACHGVGTPASGVQHVGSHDDSFAGVDGVSPHSDAAMAVLGEALARHSTSLSGMSSPGGNHKADSLFARTSDDSGVLSGGNATERAYSSPPPSPVVQQALQEDEESAPVFSKLLGRVI